MKLLILSLCLFCLAPYTFGQAPAVLWQKTLGSYDGEYPRSIRPTPDGGYIVAGTSENKGGDVLEHFGMSGTEDVWVVKLDAAGAIQWQRTLGAISVQFGAYVRPTADGGYIVAATTVDIPCTGYSLEYTLDFWLVKLAASGEVQWQKTYGGSQSEFAYALDVAPDGGFVVAGMTTSYDGSVSGLHGGIDYWVIKTDAAGTLQWQRCLGGSGDETAFAISAAPGGSYTVAGYTESTDGDVTVSHGRRDVWVVHLDAAGKIEWQKSLGGSGTEEAWSVQSTPDGGSILAAFSASNDGNVSGNHHSVGPFSDVWVVKLSSTGALQWQKCYGGRSNERVGYIQLTPDGGYVVAATAESADGDLTCNAGFDDLWVFKIGVTGDLQWQKSLGGGNTDQGFCVQPLADGSFIVSGITCSVGVPGYHPHTQYNGTCGDFWVLKLSAPLAVAPPPTVSISPARLCAGATNTLTATALYAGTTPTYTWKRGGTVVGTNSPTYTAADFVEGETVTCEVTAGDACNTVPPVSASASVIIGTGKPTLSTAVSITASTTTLCSCAPVTFSATVINAGTAPILQWQVNGQYRDGGSPVYSAIVKPDDIINVVYTDTSGCLPNGAVVSNVIQIQYAAGVTPSVSITGPSEALCAGTPALFTAVAANAGAQPAYQWTVNGTAAGTNSATFSSAALANGDVVACTVTADPQGACGAASTAISNPLTVTISGKVTPSVTVAASATTVCAGTAVTFTATSSGAGVQPLYQWTVNGSAAGTNSRTFTPSVLADGDRVVCTVTVDPLFGCAAATGASSNSVAVTVQQPLQPLVAITADVGEACAGEALAFRATVQGGGTAPSYQWLVNGMPASNSSSPLFGSTALGDGDLVSCRVVPAAGVCPALPVTSNTLAAVVYPLPTVRITPADTTVAAGSGLQLFADVSGTIAEYSWQPADRLQPPLTLHPRTLAMEENTVYTLLVKSDKGCPAEAKAMVRVLRQLHMPSAFTPDGDGLNDLFRLPPGVALQLKTFSVFDRWGNRVFTTRNKGVGWDGTYNGKKLNAGVYVFLVEGEDNDGPVKLKGQVMLVR
jgi:gliding motility-associated-like protein